MPDDNWGGMDIAESTNRLKRITGRFKRGNVASEKRPLWQRVAIGVGAVVVLVVAGYFVVAFVRSRGELDRTVVVISQLRAAVHKVAAGQNGKLTYDPGQSLLNHLTRWHFIDESFDGRDGSYHITDVVTFEGLPRQYAIVVQCAARSDCDGLRNALVGKVGFLVDKSQSNDPLVLTFNLD